jgi:hypothetical protein
VHCSGSTSYTRTLATVQCDEVWHVARTGQSCLGAAHAFPTRRQLVYPIKIGPLPRQLTVCLLTACILASRHAVPSRKPRVCPLQLTAYGVRHSALPYGLHWPGYSPTWLSCRPILVRRSLACVAHAGVQCEVVHLADGGWPQSLASHERLSPNMNR